MNQKQLKALIAAGVFSASMLAGKAYADHHEGGKEPKKDKKGDAHKKMKGNSCAGQNSCKGKGGCKTAEHECAGKNSCKGKGGCATGDFKMKSDKKDGAPAKASCKAKASCAGAGGCGAKK